MKVFNENGNIIDHSSYAEKILDYLSDRERKDFGYSF